MTLETFPRIVQGTDEWLELRRGLLTASTVGQLITPKTIQVSNTAKTRMIIYKLVAETITGEVEESPVSWDMMRGTLDEPFARQYYAENYAPVTELGFMRLTVPGRDGYQLGYSPDGLVGDEGLIEIKSRAPKKHLQTVLSQEVPAENMAQLQAGLLVSGRDWIDYVSFCGGMPLWVKRVYPVQKWRHAIINAARLVADETRRYTASYMTAIAGFPKTEKPDHHQEIRI